ncbi:MAG: hypothetical protein GF308_08065 [Candidatus Heimdallarchaeota archaeon]|nr:hypothetical protein [Candidatus Heimdallarchaeota archaeon]
MSAKKTVRNVFVLKINDDNEGAWLRSVRHALNEDVIIVGWSKIPDLTVNPTLKNITKKVLKHYYRNKRRHRAEAEKEAGQILLFLEAMVPGSYVLVPDGDKIFLAEISGGVSYVARKAKGDAAYRREVVWLNKYSAIRKGSLYRKVIDYQQSDTPIHQVNELLPKIEQYLTTIKKE